MLNFMGLNIGVCVGVVTCEQALRGQKGEPPTYSRGQEKPEVGKAVSSILARNVDGKSFFSIFFFTCAPLKKE